ncbi:DUF1428 domain-containing protein [Kaistia geumhonensis]|uniref:Uncharacterized protein YbaA (DUF1428 family) n=1 Tax=Kaistia geumhonensis TaxID=410839 RepID=A0ABU0M5X8_9HYPH|nr:DUF1428 domain-containing protein [Kaistia geumhonensis]MCX5478415.1 DUF1428 domain-containing protein [Kaistia geumhonensis]MDQ0516367.1 uncharacterized protein YbaA (DUF1428 family) [Kaistia geumhonensis]
MSYVDGFILPVPKARLDDYRRIATTASEVWREHGALSYAEYVGDDVPYGELTSFPRSVQLKDDEVVIFSWIKYRDRAHRDAVNAKVMADERIKAMMEEMPADGKRMIFGGFSVLLDV